MDANDSQGSPDAGDDPVGGGVSRRSLLRTAIVGGGAGLIATQLDASAASAKRPPKKHRHHKSGTDEGKITQTPALRKFVDPVPLPETAIPDTSTYPGADYYDVAMRQGRWQFHRDLKPGPVWGYWAENPHEPHKPIGQGYLGPTIEVTRDRPTVVKWRNELPTKHLFPSAIKQIREGIFLACTEPPPYQKDSGNPLPKHLDVWNVVHQHGGFTAPHSDGLPRQSFSPKGIHADSYTTLEPDKVKLNEALYAYTNHERASLLWYHDHGWGITSLNVYAGLAGLWPVRDPANDKLGLPGGEFEFPLLLQDRTFHEDGSLAYTEDQRTGEDTPIVNGKAYPFIAVEPRRYRLRFLNAANARSWQLRFAIPPGVVDQTALPFWLIGTDQGLRAPLQMLNFLIMPAERYDLVVDFSLVPMGTKITLENYGAPTHFPGLEGTSGPVISEVMQFKVTKRLSKGGDKTTPPRQLKLPRVAPIKATPHTRRREWVVYQQKFFGTMTFNAVPFMEPSQDFIKAGSTEIWEYINPQLDAHPMHVHLVSFQVFNRQPFDAVEYQTQYQKWINRGRKHSDKPVLARYFTGPPVPPDPDETLSHKDVVKVYPGMVTRIIINEFNPPTETIAKIPGSGATFPAVYVQHCHILEHEDDDLMHPWTIVRDHAR